MCIPLSLSFGWCLAANGGARVAIKMKSNRISNGIKNEAQAISLFGILEAMKDRIPRRTG